MKTPHQEGGKLVRKSRAVHRLLPGAMPSHPPGRIQIGLESTLQWSAPENGPERGRKPEHVRSRGGDPTKVPFGRHESRARGRGIESDTRLDAGTESDQASSVARRHQHVTGIETAMNDAFFVDQRQTSCQIDRGIQHHLKTTTGELLEVGTVDEPGDEDHLRGSKPFSAAMNPEGRTDPGIVEPGQDLVLSLDPFERPVSGIPKPLLEDDEITTGGVSRKEDATVGIRAETGEDPEAVLDVPGPGDQGIPSSMLVRSRCCQVVLRLDPGGTAGTPPSESTIESKIDGGKQRDGSAPKSGATVPVAGIVRANEAQPEAWNPPQRTQTTS